MIDCFKRVAFLPLLFATTLICHTGEPAPSPPGGRKLVNAASGDFGPLISLESPEGVKRDTRTNPGMAFDGNVHSRQVVTGVPYTFSVTLADRFRVEDIRISQSDYASEAAPKDIEITLDDGTVINKTLDLIRPEGRKPAWQTIAVGKDVRSLEIRVLSNHIPNPKTPWGGFGDIEILTGEDLATRFALANYDPKAPTYVHAPAPKATGHSKATLPEVVPPGQYPRLILSAKEITELKSRLNASEKGKETMSKFIALAEAAATLDIAFPSIEDTVANKAGKAHSLLAKNAQILGLAYAFTGDARYARKAKEILLGYAGRYEAYPRHKGRNGADSSKVTFQRLSEAMWLIQLLQSYDYVLAGDVITPEDRRLIDEKLVRAAILEIRRVSTADEVQKRAGKSKDWRTFTPPPAERGTYANWENFYSAATIMAGSLLQDQDLVDLAAADLRKAIARGIGSDGMWGEGAIGYQLFAMAVMSPALDTAAHLGIDLWNSSNGRFKELFDSPLRYAYPDGSMPGINDSARGRQGSWQTMVYDYGLLRYGDPAYSFIVNESPRQLHNSEGIYVPTRFYEPVPEPAVVNGASTLFNSLGYAVLRDDSKYLLMDYGPHGGVHGHPDKLNLLLFASPAGGAGDEMGGEPRFHGYDDPLHGQWTKQTVAHNTLCVDQRSQAPGEGRLLVFESMPGLMVMQGEAAAAYPGVLLTRTIIATESLVIDLYNARSSLNHTYDRTFRYQGALAGFAPENKDSLKPLGKDNGYQHIRVAQEMEDAPADGWKGSWTTKAGRFDVVLAAAPGEQIVRGLGPDNESLAIARQKGKRATFAAAYQLDAWKNPLSAGGVRILAATEEVQACETLQEDGTRILVFSGNGKPWEANGWRSDARLLIVRSGGKQNPLPELLIGGGTFAIGDSVEVRKKEAGNYLVRIDASNASKEKSTATTISEWIPTAPASVDSSPTKSPAEETPAGESKE